MRAVTGVRASSKGTEGRSEERPANPGVWWGWQDEPGLGHRRDVELCACVHGSSLQDGTGWAACGAGGGTWGWAGHGVSRRC